MATNLTVSSNYAGSVAGEIIGAAFKESSTIAQGLITVMPDIDFKISLRKIAYANGRTDYTCGFAPTGAITLNEVVLEPKKIKNELEICKEDLRQIWSSASMGFSAHNNNPPSDVEQALIAEILADTAEATEDDIWQGVAATDGQFGGYLALYGADATVIKAGSGITSLNGAISKSNVVAEIEKVQNAIPLELRSKSDLIFGVSPEMVVISGLPANTFTVFQKKNLYFGTGLMSDHNEIRISDGDDHGRLDGQIRYKMVYTAGVQYVNGSEIVWYLSTT